MNKRQQKKNLKKKFEEWNTKHVPQGVCISLSYFVKVLGKGENKMAQEWKQRKNV